MKKKSTYNLYALDRPDVMSYMFISFPKNSPSLLLFSPILMLFSNARLITYFCKFGFFQNYQNAKNRLQDFHFHVFFFCKSPLFGSLVTGLLTVWFLQEIHVTNAEGDRCKNHKRLTLPLAHYYYS